MGSALTGSCRRIISHNAYVVLYNEAILEFPS
jgi:hypothetical protein